MLPSLPSTNLASRPLFPEFSTHTLPPLIVFGVTPAIFPQQMLSKTSRLLLEKVGSLDHIIYTAGDNLAIMPLEDVSLDNIHAAGQVRAVSALLTAKVGSKYLTKSSNCSITFSTGSLSERPVPGGWAAPALFSAGVSSLTRQLAFDLAPIRVNCVAPGVVDTEIWAGMSEEHKERFLTAISEKMLTGQIGKAQDVAEAYLYLLKDGNATGSVIYTNGGGLLV